MIDGKVGALHGFADKDPAVVRGDAHGDALRRRDRRRGRGRVRHQRIDARGRRARAVERGREIGRSRDDL